MNEPPGARLRVGLSGLTMAEYFRDQGQDVLLFIDNIFRFVQAGSEVSALLGRMPSAVGYQPTLATEMGQLQERITSTRTGSVTSVQAIYVPADDFTDPAPRTRSRTSTPRPARPQHRREGDLSRGATRCAPRRARCSRASSPRRTTPPRPACRRCCSATRPAGHHRHPRDRRALRRGQARRAARRKIERFLSSRFSSAEQFTGTPGEYVKLDDTIRGFKEILEGKHDELPEQAFYMVGTIEQAVERGRQLGAEEPEAAAESGADEQADEAEASEAETAGRSGLARRRGGPSLLPGLGRDAGRPGVRRRGRDADRARGGGEIGVLARHAPLVAMLRAGSTRVHLGEGEVREFATGPGFFQVLEQDRAIALVDDAVAAGDIDERRGRGSSSRTAQAELAKVEAGESDRRPLAARAAHPPRREPAFGHRRELASNGRYRPAAGR